LSAWLNAIFIYTLIGGSFIS